MDALTDRIAAMRAKEAEAAKDAPREWWSVVTSNGGMQVFFCPPATAAQVRTLYYPGAGVVALDEPKAPEGTWVNLSPKTVLESTAPRKR